MLVFTRVETQKEVMIHILVSSHQVWKKLCVPFKLLAHGYPLNPLW